MHRKPGLRADVLSFLRWVTVDAEINFAHAETGLQLAKGPSFNPVGWLVEVLLYVHRNRRLIRDGEPRTATSTFTQLLSSESWLVECCFTSTETIRLIRTGSPGRPPRPSHSS